MQTRPLRAMVIVLAIVVAAGSAGVVWENQQRADVLSAAERDVQASLDRLGATVRAVGAAQEAYVVPGQSDQPWFEHVSALVQKLYDELADLRPVTHSASAAGHLQSLTASVDEFLTTDIRVREHLRIEQELMAADRILGDGRGIVDSMVMELLSLAVAERDAFAGARRATVRTSNIAVGAAAAAWLIALVVAAWRPGKSRSDTANPLLPKSHLSRNAVTVDLAAVTSIASTIARITAVDELPPLLARAGRALDATGLVLWMGAGDELSPVMASGYPPQVVRRLKPLARSGKNATLQAWASGQIQTVSGNATAGGAIAAPLLGFGGCIGVLAVEIPAGRDSEQALQAAVGMLAAQLAGIVHSWPGASGPARQETVSAPETTGNQNLRAASS
jgi:hypothetical protein